MEKEFDCAYFLKILWPRAGVLSSFWYKTGGCHPAWWELYPTLDHSVPVTRGGLDEKANLVSTSMLNNSIKTDFTFEELGWTLQPPGDQEDWDGLLTWFLEHAYEHDDLLSEWFARRWRSSRQSAIH